PVSVVSPEFVIVPEKLTFTATSLPLSNNCVPCRAVAGLLVPRKFTGIPQLFVMVTVLLTLPLQESPSEEEHTVPAALHAPGWVPELMEAAAIALFEALSEPRSKDTDHA